MTKILVIEDQSVLLESILELLSIKGYETKGALNGKIALDVLRTFEPEIILSDIMLPDYNGIDLMNQIKSIDKYFDIKFVIMTAQNPDEVYRLSMSNGAEDFLVKPFKSNDLFDAIENQINKIKYDKQKLSIILELAEEFPSPVFRVDFNFNIIYKNNCAYSFFESNVIPSIWIQNLKKLSKEHSRNSFIWSFNQQYYDISINANFENKYYNIYLNNITELQTSYNLIDKKNSQLSSQIKSLRDFNYILSHDVRNPVLNLIQLLTLIPRDKIEDNSSKEILVMLDETSANLNKILDDLSDILRAKDDNYINKSKPNNLFKILNEVLKSLNIDDKTKKIIHFDFDQKLTIEFPESSLFFIFREIIRNSIESNIANSNHDFWIKINAISFDETTIVNIADNGIGFDLNTYKLKQKNLYSKMHQSIDRKGLSLKLIESLIESHNGRIDINTELNKGTNITLCFSM